jgi:hypothetical protein
MPGDDVFGRPPVPPIPPVGIDYGNSYPMIDDPEAAVTQWPEEVWAFDDADAARKCQDLAGLRTREGGTRVVVSRVRKLFDANGSSRYECLLEGEN